MLTQTLHQFSYLKKNLILYAKDLFDGKVITVWKDEDFVFMSFPQATINFTFEQYDEIKEEGFL